MRAIGVLAVLVASVWARPHVAMAEQPTAANVLTPVQTFTAADFPQLEPGKNAFVPQPKGQWSCGIVACGPWVYAVQSASYVLRFRRDTATARLEYLGATAFDHAVDGRRLGYVRSFCIRRLPGGGAMLYLCLVDHALVLSNWYCVDMATGELAKQSRPDKAKVNIAYELTPDQNDYYVHTPLDEKSFGWFKFAADGAPVEKGRIACPNPYYGEFAGSELLVASQDGRRGYFISSRGWHADNIGRFNRDPTTGTVTLAASRPAWEVGADRLFYDPEYGHLYTIGSKLCVFGPPIRPQTPAAEPAKPRTGQSISPGPLPAHPSMLADLAARPAGWARNWPQFRGPAGDGQATASMPRSRAWCERCRTARSGGLRRVLPARCPP